MRPVPLIKVFFISLLVLSASVWANALEVRYSDYTAISCDRDYKNVGMGMAVPGTKIEIVINSCGKKQKVCQMESYCRFVKTAVFEEKYNSSAQLVPEKVFDLPFNKPNPDIFHSVVNVGCMVDGDAACLNPLDCYKQKGLVEAASSAFKEGLEPVNQPLSDLGKQ